MTARKPAGEKAPDTMLQDYAQAVSVALRAFEDAKINRKGPELIDARAQAYMRTLQLYWQIEHSARRRVNARASADLPRAKDPVRQKVIEVFRAFRVTERTRNDALQAMLQDAHNGLTVRHEGGATYRFEDEDAADTAVRVCGKKAIEAMDRSRQETGLA